MAILKVLNVKDQNGNVQSYNVGYSSNDFTTELKTKLEGIEEGAQANVLDGVKVDGVDQSIVDKKVNIDLATPIATAKGEAIDASKVTMSESAGTDSVLKVYTFSQNGTEIGKVNVPKDLVVSAGEIVEVEGVKYLRLTIANQEAPVDIAVSDLVDAYTGSTYITVGSDNSISVKFAELDAELAKEASVVGAAIKGAKDAADAAQSAAEAAQSTADTAKSTAETAKATADANKTKLDGIAEGANKVAISYTEETATLEIAITNATV